MIVPEHLQHKPIIAVNDYDKKDGQYAPNSDAKALSIGQAQYDEDEISAKVFRHTGHNWSRQSEELPIHRVLDLAIFIVASMQSTSGGQKSVSSLKETIIAPRKTSRTFRLLQSEQKNIETQVRRIEKIIRHTLIKIFIMKNDKEKFYLALKNNNGQLDEIALGESISLTSDKTTQIIEELVNEGKVEFQSFGLCSYKVIQ